jgi:hypothetical protein
LNVAIAELMAQINHGVSRDLGASRRVLLEAIKWKRCPLGLDTTWRSTSTVTRRRTSR